MNVRNQVILLVGKTGAGKSTLGNLLLGRLNNDGPFVVSDRMDSETRECRIETLSINDQTYDIVDTPGIFDTRRHVNPFKEIAKFVHKCAYGVKAIILVLEAKRLTNENWNTLNEIRMFLGKDAINNIIVVFSNATREQIRDRNQMQQAWNNPVDSFIRKINYRWSVSPNPDYFSFDKSTNERRLMEIKSLITNIREIYTTEQLERNLKKQAEAKRLKEVEDKRKKEAYENNLKKNAIKEAEKLYKAEQEKLQRIIEEERRERERERERYQRERERYQRERERERERERYQREQEREEQYRREEKVMSSANHCYVYTEIVHEQMPVYHEISDVSSKTVEVPTLEKDKDTDKEIAAVIASMIVQSLLLLR